MEYEAEPINEKLTALGGLPLLVETYRALGLAASVKRNVSIKQRDRGFDEATYLESFVILNAAGGECLEDFEPLRQDEGLHAMINHPVPSPEAARKFLNAFHEEARIVEAQQALPLGQVSYIPEESCALQGLGKVNQDLIGELGRRCTDQKIATIDLDGTMSESWKKQAQPTYQGGKGYQPILALWAEMDVLVADEFRDGNVPGLQAPLRVAQRAFTALPGTVTEYYFRGDSACHEQQLVRWLRDEKRSSGPAGVIHFAIRVRMNPTLKKKIAALPESLWKPYQDSETESTKECADVSNYWPEADELKECGPLRYVAIRIRKRQGELFADGNEVKHYAVVSNQWEWPAKKLLEWRREKAGSIEAAHDVLKNELAAGVMPCSRFGANASWLRMAVITYNLLSALKPPQADAFFDLQHGWKNRPSRAANGGEAKPRHRSIPRLVASPASTAFAHRDVARPTPIAFNLSTLIAAGSGGASTLRLISQKNCWERRNPDAWLHNNLLPRSAKCSATLSQPFPMASCPYVRITVILIGNWK